MRGRIWSGAIALVFGSLLMGCRADPPSQPPSATPPDACGAADLQSLEGQSATVLETMKFAQPVRIVRPGMAVTMDYRPDRLNIEIDAQEKIARVHCS